MSDLDGKELCCVRIEHVTRVSYKHDNLHIFTSDGRCLSIPYDDPVEARQNYTAIQDAMRKAGSCWRLETPDA